MAPMVINGGVGRLEQRFYHPEAGQSAHNAEAANTQRASGDGVRKYYNNDYIASAVKKIIACMGDNKKKEERMAIVSVGYSKASCDGAAHARRRRIRYQRRA
jgi:hypothetical protein